MKSLFRLTASSDEPAERQMIQKASIGWTFVTALGVRVKSAPCEGVHSGDDNLHEIKKMFHNSYCQLQSGCIKEEA